MVISPPFQRWEWINQSFTRSPVGTVFTMNLTLAITGASGTIFGREALCALPENPRRRRNGY